MNLRSSIQVFLSFNGYATVVHSQYCIEVGVQIDKQETRGINETIDLSSAYVCIVEISSLPLIQMAGQTWRGGIRINERDNDQLCYGKRKQERRREGRKGRYFATTYDKDDDSNGQYVLSSGIFAELLMIIYQKYRIELQSRVEQKVMRAISKYSSIGNKIILRY